MATEQDNEYCDHPSLGKDVHDKMRKAPVDIGGKETTEKKLMRPQTGEEVDG